MIKPHPYAELFPMFPPDQLVELSKNIKRRGQRRKGRTFNGLLLDGRNRQEACTIAGVEFKTDEFKGTDAEALDYVLQENVLRRHLSAGVRAEIAAKIANMQQGERTDLPTDGGKLNVSQSEAAAKLGVSTRSVQRAVAKSKEPAATSWTHDDLKADEELYDGFTAISAVYGLDDTRAIRTKIGLKRKDVLVLSRLKKQQMLDIKELVMGSHWAPQKALEFLSKMPTIDSTNEEMQNWCLAQPEKKIVADIGGFRHTCEKISK